jgi:hypothetical protein
MPVNTEIKVQYLDQTTYEVVAIEGLLKTRHQVIVPPDHIEELDLPDRDMATVVREMFVMLLEREPATSVPAVATLEALGNHYPDFWPELQVRLAHPPAPRPRYPGPEAADVGHNGGAAGS